MAKLSGAWHPCRDALEPLASAITQVCEQLSQADLPDRLSATSTRPSYWLAGEYHGPRDARSESGRRERLRVWLQANGKSDIAKECDERLQAVLDRLRQWEAMARNAVQDSASDIGSTDDAGQNITLRTRLGDAICEAGDDVTDLATYTARYLREVHRNLMAQLEAGKPSQQSGNAGAADLTYDEQLRLACGNVDSPHLTARLDQHLNWICTIAKVLRDGLPECRRNMASERETIRLFRDDAAVQSKHRQFLRRFEASFEQLVALSQLLVHRLSIFDAHLAASCPALLNGIYYHNDNRDKEICGELDRIATSTRVALARAIHDLETGTTGEQAHPKKRKRVGGRPIDNDLHERYLRLLSEWDRAKDAKVSQKEFCEGDAAKLSELKKAVNWRAVSTGRGTLPT